MVKKFVFDTNIWISLFYKNKYLKLVTLLEKEKIKVFTSRENIVEFMDIHRKHDVIKKLLPLPTEKYCEAIDELSEYFEPQKRYALLPDYKDNYLIDLAHQTKSYLVTNDKHFKTARKLRRPRIKIITVQQFYKLIKI